MLAIIITILLLDAEFFIGKYCWPFNSVSPEPDTNLTQVINNIFLNNEYVLVILRMSGPN